MITVLFFAQLSEQLNLEKITINESAIQRQQPITILDLKKYLCSLDKKWGVLNDASVLVAVNQDLSHNQSRILEGDEVAFFPPVTGG